MRPETFLDTSDNNDNNNNKDFSAGKQRLSVDFRAHGWSIPRAFQPFF